MAASGSIIVAIGGGDPSERILDFLFDRLGSAPDPRVVVMTVASDEKEGVKQAYNSMFRKRGVNHVEIVNVWTREDAYTEASLEKLDRADLIYFTGGDQLNITSLLGGSPLHKHLMDRLAAGIIVAGTSAGAAMMSGSMILSGAGDMPAAKGGVEIAPGLNLISDVFIDTHFSERGRHGRLLTAVAHHPQILGIGLDESTAIIVQGSEFRVLGDGTVTIVNGEKMEHTDLVAKQEGEPIGMFGVCLHVLPDGYTFDLSTKTAAAPASRAEKAKGA